MKYHDNSTSGKEFVSGILLVQIVATYLVILGHSFPFITSFPDWLDSARTFLYAFHMPLFVWISGYLLIYTRQSLKYNTRQFAARRAIKLLIPYIILTIVAFIPKYAVQPYLNDSIELDAESIVRVFLVPRENIWGHFWFLPMIFILGIAGFLADRIFVKYGLSKLGWAIITAVLLILYIFTFNMEITQWFSLKDIVIFGWVFALGALCACYDSLTLLRNKYRIPISIICVSLAAILYIYASYVPFGAIRNILIAILMIISLVEPCMWLALKIHVSRTAVYTQTFTIFLLSWPVQAVANVLTERILHLPYYMIMPIQFLAGIIGPVLLILIINYIEHKFKIRWISFCLGK